jgi:hypothetical protein
MKNNRLQNPGSMKATSQGVSISTDMASPFYLASPRIPVRSAIFGTLIQSLLINHLLSIIIAKNNICQGVL